MLLSISAVPSVPSAQHLLPGQQQVLRHASQLLSQTSSHHRSLCSLSKCNPCLPPCFSPFAGFLYYDDWNKNGLSGLQGTAWLTSATFPSLTCPLTPCTIPLGFLAVPLRFPCSFLTLALFMGHSFHCYSWTSKLFSCV